MVIEYCKEKNLVQQINVNLNPNQPVINNNKHNKSILNNPSMITNMSLLILSFLVLALITIDYEKDIMIYKSRFFFWLVVSPLIHKIFFPCIILYNNPGMRNMMFRTIKDIFHLQNPPHPIYN